MSQQSLINQMLIAYARNFPITKGKERVLSFFQKRLSGEKQVLETQIKFGNLRMRCDLSKRIQRRLYFYGTYEEEECRHWAELAKSANTMFDVGANVGLYSLVGADANRGANVHSFEPTPDIYGTFTHNIHLNNLSNITANQAGVGSESGTATLQLCAGEGGTNDGMNYIGDNDGQRPGIEVPIYSLDDYCKARNIEAIDLMKMDIEGGEHAALRGAQGLLSRHAVKCLFLELTEWSANRSGTSTQAIKKLLIDHGYRIYARKQAGYVPVPAEGTHNGLNVVVSPTPLQ